MLIHVKVETDASHYNIEQIRSTSFKIKEKEPAKENRANIKVIDILAEHFNISTSKIKIITGHHMPGKILELELPQ